ncbi:hypothetical protein PG990_006496 [Apiospora arundinis]
MQSNAENRTPEETPEAAPEETPEETSGAELPALPLPKPLSYGVEIEAVVHYVLDGEEDPLGHIEGLPEPIRVDLGEGRKKLGIPKFKFSVDRQISQLFQEAMTKTLEKYNIPSKGTTIACKNPESLEHHVAQERLEKVGRWVVKDDQSIEVPKDPQNCRFQGVEINTSVEADSPESFEMLKFVINCLKAEHRLSVNPSCGLHVHVGNGAEAFSLNNIRRISALLWSAECLVDTVHPPTRRMNFWCAPLRTVSTLADLDAPYDSEEDSEEDSSAACHYHGGEVRFGERSMGWRELHQHKHTVESYLQSRGLENNFQPWLDDDAVMEYKHSKFAIYSRPTEIEKQIKKYKELEEMFRGVVHAEPSRSYTFAVPEKMQGPESSKSSSEISPEGSSETSVASEDMLSQQQLANRIADLPKDRIFSPTTPRRLTNRPYCAGSKFTKEDLKRVHLEWKGWMDTLPVSTDTIDLAAEKPADNLAGVIRLLESKSSCEIARLLCLHDEGTGKLAYHFDMYDCESHEAGERHTIEFRQAESSLDTAWVATWAKICVGLVKFAINAPPDSFMQVITNCDLAERREKTGQEYDVVDLLGQVGLIAEANVAAERMWQNREEWRLSYSEVDGADSDGNHHPSNQPGGRGGSDPGDDPDSGGDDSSKPDGGQSDDSKKPHPNDNESVEGSNQQNPEQENERPVEMEPEGKPETEKPDHGDEDKPDAPDPGKPPEYPDSDSKKKKETGNPPTRTLTILMASTSSMVSTPTPTQEKPRVPLPTPPKTRQRPQRLGLLYLSWDSSQLPPPQGRLHPGHKHRDRSQRRELFWDLEPPRRISIGSNGETLEIPKQAREAQWEPNKRLREDE